MFLYEAVNPLHGLPKHWIKYLTERFGKRPGYYYGKEMAGESSNVKELPQFDAPTIKNAFKDTGVIAIIGRKEGQPIFMIARHYDKSTKYLFFEVTPGHGQYYSRQTGYYSRGRKNKDDDYTLQEVIEIIERIIADKDFSNVTIETITNDPVRGQKIEDRGKLRNIIDPLEPTGYREYDKRPYVSRKQKELIKKYAAIKRPKLDQKVDKEIEIIKKKIMDTIDIALTKTIDDIKHGYSFSVDKKSIGEKIAAQLNLDPLRKLADAYSTLASSYSDDDTPGEVARKLKRLGLQ